jgi:hypothetical protein
MRVRIQLLALEQLEQLNWESADHPPHSLDLVPSDFYLFTNLKNWL